jgi:hypothetical protein
MSPSVYLNQIILPTVDEYFAEPGNLRRAILACVVTYHIRDYLKAAGSCSKTEVNRRIRALCAFSFDVVEGVCNGSKHFRNRLGDFGFTPGDEKPLPAFYWDVPGSGWDVSRWDIPGLEVEHHGQRVFIDLCLCAVLAAVGRAFPEEFSGVDLDGHGKRVPGWPSVP